MTSLPSAAMVNDLLMRAADNLLWAGYAAMERKPFPPPCKRCGGSGYEPRSLADPHYRVEYCLDCDGTGNAPEPASDNLDAEGSD